MSGLFQNIYHLRRVADTAAKACYVCHKPSSSVMITPDNKDFFYVCPVHLKDRHFCSPIVDTEDEEKKKKEEALAKEIEKVKKEYEEKQKKKKDKTKEKKSDEESKKEEGSSSDKKEGNDEKERDDKVYILPPLPLLPHPPAAQALDIESLKKSAQPTSTSDDGPRIFALHKNFYQMRIDRLRNLEAAKRNRQRLQDPSFFPSVPSGGL
ncbi:AAA-ATPase Vps4-associated protein 1-domain-containing protein [Aspergillus pseudonomiae]|uniref:AAA-ATPase Vps4-associated protein 1-domain-containing protein n=1 Tax=Aspergillus pseudonomiae TaxID=1506151 RepID=A0A5N7CY75_9EURO|nr:AAA-ATPase Vps4-associated protein 1-domain-containing protein [Aspergillus pseudonomiae]KAE8399135.1 AAA-ATPase Vps4-associated protein 1-domain-containing protein [Aspergillus pseudonomiae]